MAQVRQRRVRRKHFVKLKHNCFLSRTQLHDIVTQQLLGRFCYFPTVRQSPAGPIYATFGHLFEDDELVLFAMLSLCVNRWVDYYGLAS